MKKIVIALGGNALGNTPAEQLELVRQTEEEGAREEIQRLDEKLHAALDAVESAYAKNKDRWVDTLLAMIVGVQP